MTRLDDRLTRDDRRLHIAMICVSLRAGGTERVLTRLANYLAQRHCVTLITLVGGPSFYGIAKTIDICAPDLDSRSSSSALRRLSQMRHIFNSLRMRKPDICLVFGEDIAAATCVIGRLAGVSSVITLFRGTPERSLIGVNSRLSPLLLRLSTKIVVQTETGKAALSDRYQPSRMVVIPNPIKLPNTSRSFERRQRVIINVGSMGRKKNQAALLRAFSCARGHENWQLLLVGDGPDRAALEELTQELGLQDNVQFTGQRDDVEQLLQTARIFAFTSLSEGFPNALAEAMAAGCAPISYDCPTGPGDMIEHRVNGFLIPNDDEDCFTKHLAQLMADDALQVRLSQSARASMTRFAETEIMDKFAKLILEVSSGTQELRSERNRG